MLPFTSSLHTPRSVLVAALALTACAGSGGGPRSSSPPRADASVNSDVAPTDVFAPPGALGALPRAQTVAHGRFMSADRCAFCHEAQGGSALRDARGRDVSPYTLWRGSMMAFSARDPYWLAAFAHEREENPRGVDYIDRVCTRCHAPAGSVAFEDDGDRLTFARITTGTEASSALARDGVTCTACHQIEPTNLGRPESFTGGYTVGSARRIYGPHADPFPMPMQNMVGYTPTHSTHVTTSALCATCHTVITRALDAEGRPTGAEFPEQIPYLEWQDSQWRDEAPAGARPTRCVDCHMPSTDLDGAALRTAIATRPMMLDARAPLGRHVFVGGNAYMLALLAGADAWSGRSTPRELIDESVRGAEAFLQRAATLTVESMQRDGASVVAVVRVTNETGHRFPTAYPSRRAWLHLRALDANGAVRFESGRWDARGAIVDGRGERLDAVGTVIPHRDRVTNDREVQVWEAALADRDGRSTHTLLHAERYLKDDRIPPRGHRTDHPNARWTSPTGVDGDTDYGSDGIDRVTFALPAETARVEVELVFQSVSPAAVEALGAHPTPAYTRFRALVDAAPPEPRVLARATRAITSP